MMTPANDSDDDPDPGNDARDAERDDDSATGRQPTRAGHDDDDEDDEHPVGSRDQDQHEGGPDPVFYSTSEEEDAFNNFGEIPDWLRKAWGARPSPRSA
jgi:hypothetical protein